MAYTIVEGNLLPVMTVTLGEDGNAFILQLTDTVTLVWNDANGTRHSGSMSIVTAASGIVRRTWEDGDTDVVGECLGQIDVLRVGETVPRTFPNTGALLRWHVNRHL